MISTKMIERESNAPLSYELPSEQIVTLCDELQLPFALTVDANADRLDVVVGIPQQTESSKNVEKLPLYKASLLIAATLGVEAVKVTFIEDRGIGKIHKIEVIGAQTEVDQDDTDDSFQLIIPAGGLGSRLRPLTLEIPKPLLPIHGVPLLSRIRKIFEADMITSTNVIINEAPGTPTSYKELFSQWSRANLGTQLVDQLENVPHPYTVLEIAMRGDERFAIIVHGDKFLNFDNQKMDDLLRQLKSELSDSSFLLVGKKSESSGRKLKIDEQGSIQAVSRANDEKVAETGFGVAFMVFDTERLPITLSSELATFTSFTEFFQFLVSNGIKGKIVELPEDFTWRNINTFKDYEAELELSNKTTDISTLPDPFEVYKLHAREPESGCVFPEEKVLIGGRSGSEVIKVIGPDSIPLVRKSKYRSLPVDEKGSSQYHAYLLDKFLMDGRPSGMIEITKSCSLCQLQTCTLGPFVEGKMLDELIDTDLNAAHTIRMDLLKVLIEKGYFKQNHLMPGDPLWLQWLQNRKSFLGNLEEWERTNNPEQWLDGINLIDATKRAIDVLINPTIQVPHGFFPRDLNPSNIIINHSGQIRVVDQTMMFGDPAIVPLKLVIGWRNLSIQHTGEKLAAKSAEFKATQHIVDQLDNTMLEAFTSLYPIYKEFRPRLYAGLTIRHIIGLLRLRRSFANDPALFAAEEIIKGYLEKSLKEISVGSPT